MKNLYTLLTLLCMISGSLYGQLIINEVLYDPSNNMLDGDANGDGVYDQEQDAFIEFVNNGFDNFDASGYQIWDDETTGSLRYVIPAGTVVPPFGALVVFGGGTPTGDFGGAIVLATDSLDGLDLTNSGEVIAIKDPMDVTVLTFDSDALSNNPNESYTRNPDITGEFEQHNDNTPLLWSPGTRLDGSAFGTSFSNDVSFTVDLSQYTDPFTTAYVNGTFNGWCGTCNPMTDDDMDGIWNVTLPLTQDSIEYKFTLDGFSAEETFTPGDPCTKTTDIFTNRFTLITGNTVLPQVCWESCDACFPDDIALSLTGILDFDLADGGVTGKGIHVTADAMIMDLSEYGIGVANNGGGTDGEEYTFPMVSVMAGDEILVARDTAAMAVFFGSCYAEFDHVFVANDAISQNGDDAIELFKDGVVIETFGDADVDGTGEEWEYSDTWAYKDMGVWTYGAAGCINGALTTQISACPYPFCPEVADILVSSITVQGEGGVSIIDVLDGTLQMEATVMPIDATDPTFTWSVDNEGIATIDANGLLTAVEDGTVVVTATANDDSGQTGSASIDISNQGTVVEPPVLSLTGILDFDLTAGGSTGKGIHVTAEEDISDLSEYGIGVANNGGGTDDEEYTFPAVSVMAGDEILVARDSSEMAIFFGSCYAEFDHVFVANSSISQNGDDAIELFKDGVVVETFGDADVDGTGEEWEYTGTWAYKDMGVWTYGAAGCVGGALTTQVSACPYPFCPEVADILVSSITVQGEGGVSIIDVLDGTLQMEATVMPMDATDPTFTWSVDNEGIATIDANGLLTALEDGNVVVTATANDDSGQSGSASIDISNQGTVVDPPMLSLKGILDFDLAAGGPSGKGVHVTAEGDISDLADYGIGVANNGGGTDGEEYTFPSIAVSLGDEILVVRDSLEMSIFFDECFSEFDHVLIANDNISQNGNDAIELFQNGAVIETFGDADVDGTGEEWEYSDTWAYKEIGVWIYGAAGCVDGAATTQASDCPYPICPAGPILVNSITVQGEGGVSSIDSPAGTLQMEAEVLPLNATDPSFFWSVNDESIATIDASGLLTAVANGTVVVTATANDDSSETGSTSIVISNQISGINQISAKQKLMLYPNPSSDFVTLMTDDQITEFALFTVTGKLVEDIILNGNRVNISSLETGMYFIVANVNGAQLRSTFTKM